MSYTKEKAREYFREYYKEHIDKQKARSKKYYAEHRTERQQYSRKKSYGISSEEYDLLYDEQDGCCAICGKHQSELTKALHVDHDHITGKIRGLLCKNCNILLGAADDDITILLNSINYLSKEGG
jgi:hypothetical protein